MHKKKEPIVFSGGSDATELDSDSFFSALGSELDLESITEEDERKSSLHWHLSVEAACWYANDIEQRPEFRDITYWDVQDQFSNHYGCYQRQKNSSVALSLNDDDPQTLLPEGGRTKYIVNYAFLPILPNPHPLKNEIKEYNIGYLEAFPDKGASINSENSDPKTAGKPKTKIYGTNQKVRLGRQSGNNQKGINSHNVPRKYRRRRGKRRPKRNYN